jgi:4-oxalocrotonate tautomerase
MPLIQVQLFEGRSDDVKREYAKAITEADVKIMGCTAASVDVIY